MVRGRRVRTEELSSKIALAKMAIDRRLAHRLLRSSNCTRCSRRLMLQLSFLSSILLLSSFTYESVAQIEAVGLNNTVSETDNPISPTNHDASSSRDDRKPFNLGPVITDWDQQRGDWLGKHPHLRTTSKGRPRMILVTSSPPQACEAPEGDHYQLKSIKNKMDYCRLHDIEIYYNMAVMDRSMDGFWVKLPIIRKLMLHHPEAEWIWWMDSDAMFTNMRFEIPVEKYVHSNLVIHGWDKSVYEDKSWFGLNAGIFLLRNCQWTLNLLDMWAPMGEKYGNHRSEVGAVLSEALTDRSNFESDDQAALIFLLSSKKDELKDRVFLENAYLLHGYWKAITDKYEQMEKDYHDRPGSGGNDWPFITHFVGCKFCSGKYNSYPLDECRTEMKRAYNFADNQVLQAYGYQHESLLDPAVKRTRPESIHTVDSPGH